MISLAGKTIQKLNAPPTSGTVPDTGVLFKWETVGASGQIATNYKDAAGSSYTGADVSAPTPAATINAPATTSSLGGVIIGSGLEVTSGGTVSLSSATASVLGGVKTGTNTGISITSGTIALSVPTSSALGGVIVGTGLNVTSGGVVSVPVANVSSAGSVIVGSGLDVTSGGTLSVAKQATIVPHSSGFTVAQSDCFKTHLMVGSGLAVTLPYSAGGVISAGSWVNIVDSNNSGGVVVQAESSSTLNGADAGSKTIAIGEGGTVLVAAANVYQCVGVFGV